MPQIKAITDEMLEMAGKIHEGKEAISASQNSVLGIMQNLGADFSGKLPTAMLELMLAQKDKYAAVCEAIKDYGDFVEHAAQTYEWTDKEIARWAEKLGKGDLGGPAPPRQGPIPYVRTFDEPA
jgi:uncharacterized protein YukE